MTSKDTESKVQNDRVRPSLMARGARFYDRAIETFSFSDSEHELLVEACRLLDSLQVMDDTIGEEGMTFSSSTGVKVHPFVAERRQTTLALGRVLAQLAIPDDDGQTVQSLLQSRGKASAAKRWATNG